MEQNVRAHARPNVTGFKGTMNTNKAKHKYLAPTVTIFTDGACKGNPGRGGWGAILHSNGKQKCISGRSPYTTNNQMELTAVVSAIKSLKCPCYVTVITDSRYVVDGANKYIKGWLSRNWMTKEGKPVKNQSLWKELLEASTPHLIQYQWVKGHNGHTENERADKLANAAI